MEVDCESCKNLNFAVLEIIILAKGELFQVVQVGECWWKEKWKG
jgi:hypothetical protein